MDFDWCLSKINLFYQRVECMSERGYMSDDIWKLNVMIIIKSYTNKTSISAYILKSSDL